MKTLFKRLLICSIFLVGCKKKEIDSLIKKADDLNKLKRYDEALVCYDKAIELDPNYKEAYYGKADILEGLGRYEKTLEVWDKVIELEPNYKYAYYWKADILENMEGRDDEARNCREKYESLK